MNENNFEDSYANLADVANEYRFNMLDKDLDQVQSYYNDKVLGSLLFNLEIIAQRFSLINPDNYRHRLKDTHQEEVLTIPLNKERAEKAFGIPKNAGVGNYFSLATIKLAL